jgi:hypothetical protein
MFSRFGRLALIMLLVSFGAMLMTTRGSIGAETNPAAPNLINQLFVELNQVREKDPRNEIDCTNLVRPLVDKYHTIGPVIEMIEKSGFTPVKIRQNDKEFVYFDIDGPFLRRLEQSYFDKNDRVNVVFVVKDRSENAEILNFSVKIFNSRGDL